MSCGAVLATRCRCLRPCGITTLGLLLSSPATRGAVMLHRLLPTDILDSRARAAGQRRQTMTSVRRSGAPWRSDTERFPRCRVSAPNPREHGTSACLGMGTVRGSLLPGTSSRGSPVSPIYESPVLPNAHCAERHYRWPACLRAVRITSRSSGRMGWPWSRGVPSSSRTSSTGTSGRPRRKATAIRWLPSR